MDVPRGYHTKRSKSDRERQISYNITYMWNLKKNDRGVPLWHMRLRIQSCHCSGSGCCHGTGLIPGLGTSICHKCSQKKRKKRQRKKNKKEFSKVAFIKSKKRNNPM